MIIIYFLVKVFSYMYVTICWCIFQALFLLKSYTCNYSKMPFSRKLLTHCHFSIEFGYVCVAENSPDWAHCHLMILPTGTVFVVKMLPLSVSQSQLVCCKRSSNFYFFIFFHVVVCFIGILSISILLVLSQNMTVSITIWFTYEL